MHRCEKCDIDIPSGGCPACDARRKADHLHKQAEIVRSTYKTIKGVRNNANRKRALMDAEESLIGEARNWRSVAGDLVRLEKERQDK